MNALLAPTLLAQYGLVSRRQAMAAGVSSRQLERMLAAGLLVSVFAGVYRDPSVPVTLEQRAMAATLAAGRGSTVSHRMAVAMLGARNFACDLSEVTATTRVDRPGLIAHRTTVAPPSRLVRKVAVTTPARTLIDCGTVVAAATVGRWLDGWLSGGVLKLRDLESELDHCRRHPGARVVHQLLASRLLTKEEADSPAEMALGELFVRHGLEPPVLHHLVSLPTGATYELDWSYPELMAAFEMDGYGIHLRSMGAFDGDRFRRNDLVTHGWAVLNFTRSMLTNNPKRIIEQVADLLDRNLDRNLDGKGIRRR